ncbi:hypothetical protein U1Q18_013675, partial [Sarracenia purpurea var. burkii]
AIDEDIRLTSRLGRLHRRAGRGSFGSPSLGHGVVAFGKVGGNREGGLVCHGVGIREHGNLAKDDGNNIPDQIYGGTCGVKRGPTKEAYLRNPYSAKINTTIFIDNIPDQIDNTWLCNAFNLCGPVG